MSRRLRSRDIEIFNFSFLDILACTIGLLIFIMVMVFILQAGSPVADTAVVITKTNESTARATHDAERDNRIAASLEGQAGQLHSTISPEISTRRDRAIAAVSASRALYDRTALQLRQTEVALDSTRRSFENSASQRVSQQARLAAARLRLEKAAAALALATPDGSGSNVHFLPHKHSGDAGRYRILHVDCRADDVLLLELGDDGSPHEVGRSSLDGLASADSQYARKIAEYERFASPLVLFWIRPNGVRTYEEASKALPAGMAHGHEPADSAWNFADAVTR